MKPGDQNQIHSLTILNEFVKELKREEIEYVKVSLLEEVILKTTAKYQLAPRA